MSQFDEETEYLDAIYNVSKGSNKRSPYTKKEVAGAYLGATGVAAGAGIASRGGMKVRDAKQELNRVPRNVPFDTKGHTFKNSAIRVFYGRENTTNRLITRKQALRSSIRGGNKLKAAGLGLAGLGGAGLVASEASAYNRNKVSKGSTKKNSAGPYTKTDVAAQLGAATGIGTGVSLARLGNTQAKYVNHQQTKLDNFLAGKDPKNFSPATAKSVNNITGHISYLRRASSRTKAAGIGLAGLGAAGMLASDASAYKRNKGKNMKVSKSAYNMLPKGLSAARKAKALEMAPAKFSAKKQAAYDRMGLSATQGDIADIVGTGALGVGIGASLPPMYRKRDKMAAARKAKKVSKAFTLTGQEGDKRNSKYAAGAYLGAAGGAAAGGAIGARSAGTTVGQARRTIGLNSYKSQISGTVPGMKPMAPTPVKGLKAITRGRGIGAVVGTVGALGAVGAARKMNRNNMAPVAKSAFGVEHTVAKASGADLARMITSSIPGSRAVPVGGKAVSGGRMFPTNAKLDRVNLNKNPKTSKSSIKAGQNMGRGIASGMSRGYFGPKGV